MRRPRCSRRSSAWTRRRSSSGLGRRSTRWSSLAYFGMGATIQRQIQLQHVDPGSPRMPNWRPSVLAATSWRTASALILRAAATRATWASAEAGLMCGSSPLPEAVNRSAGTGAGEGGVLGAEFFHVARSHGRSASDWSGRGSNRRMPGRRSHRCRRPKGGRENTRAA